MSSDQRASILCIIKAEMESVAHYAQLLRDAPAHPLATRWKALKRWHTKEIGRRRKEMRQR